MSGATRSDFPAVVTVGAYDILVRDGFPPGLEEQRAQAKAVHHLEGKGDFPSYVAVRRQGATWPELVVTQNVDQAGSTCATGVLLLPETECLFVGAGSRVAIFRRVDGRWRLLGTDTADTGFSGWARHRDVVLMSAELELAAWNPRGEKLWSTFVEPPWAYSVSGETVRLDVMGKVTHFALHYGP